MKDFFLKDKPVMALVTIRRNREDIYCSMISKKIDTTSAHTVKTVARLEDEGLVESHKNGRKKILELTDEGQTYADKFIDILDEMNGHNDSNIESSIKKDLR